MKDRSCLQYHSGKKKPWGEEKNPKLLENKVFQMECVNRTCPCLLSIGSAWFSILFYFILETIQKYVWADHSKEKDSGG